MARDTLPAKPSILIYISPYSGQEARLRQIQAGIEEEGIPCTWRSAEGDAALLARRGAEESQLEVGIGVAADGLCGHYRKLPEGKPLFLLPYDSTPPAWRQLGCNAARLVKGTPFKLESSHSGDSDPTPAGTEEWLFDIIRKIVQEKLKDHGR